MQYDILIRNGKVVDGSGAPAYEGDVAIRNGVVERVGGSIEGDAKEVIDASGLVVTPGFIDNHTHSDRTVFRGSNSYNYLEQGVTTQICGQCGSSPAPYNEAGFYKYRRQLKEEEVDEAIRICRTPSSFLEAAERQSFGTNMAFFIGHSALRGKAMGYSPERSSKEQMACMKEDLREAMEAGFLGYSTGLVYAPSVYGDREEFAELAEVMKPYGGIYASHIRSEGDASLEAVREAISVGDLTGCKVLISHLKVIGKHNEGLSVSLLREIDEAWKRGIRVYADQYPYTAGSAPMNSLIPPKYMAGGMELFLKRLADPEIRRDILCSIFSEPGEFESGIRTAGFGGCLVVGAGKTPQYVNRTLEDIGREEGKEPMDVLCDLLLANDGIAQGIYFSQNGTDLLRIMGHPKVFCGSDWSDYSDSRVDCEHIGGGHPRATASMVRRLELVRDFRLRTMEESVKNLTFDTAEAMNLPGLGLIREGWAANLCVFDYDRLHAVCDYVHPFRKNQGIQWVIVNGQIAVKDGTATGVRAGKVCKRR